MIFDVHYNIIRFRLQVLSVCAGKIYIFLTQSFVQINLFSIYKSSIDPCSLRRPLPGRLPVHFCLLLISQGIITLSKTF